MSKKPKVGMWSGLTAVTAVLTAGAIVGTTVAFHYTTTVNNYLDADTYKIIKGDSDEDTEYFKSDFTSDEERESYEAELCAQVEAEGAALLKNDNNALPLASGAKVSLFGHGSVDLMYGGTGSGSVDTSKAPNFKQALEDQGIQVNSTLWDLYSSDDMMKNYSRITPAAISDTLEANTQYAVNEAPWGKLSSAESSFADYGDAAIVVFSRSGGEGADLPSGENGTNDSWIKGQEGDGNYLALSAEEKELLQNLKTLKDNGTFKKIIVLINSFKTNAAVNTDTFALPNEDTFVGWQNYIKGMTFGNYPFIKAVFYSLFITLVSSALILICTSMAAWYVARVGSLFSKIVYYLCVFSMVVPFQMVMFTLSRTAEQVKLPYFSFTSMAFAKIGLNTPWTIPIVYLGFGAGLAVFMFSGFVKTIPLEIEEAAAIDGCGPVRTFFLVVLPMLKPTFISVGVLEIMWVWNDFLLPYLVLDLNKYRTIPIVIQYLKGSYGQVDMGATMALILLSIVPVIIFYLCCQKHIIKGVAAGAVKG